MERGAEFTLTNLVAEMSLYTGISIDRVVELVEPTRKDNYKTWAEFKYVDPQTPEEVVLFNKTCRQFFFECALHMPWAELQSIPLESRVLDYGAGLGTDCLWLYYYGYRPIYYDINLLMSDFFNWRCRERGILEEEIPRLTTPVDLEWFDYYDAISFRDVLEHIPNYDEVLTNLCVKVREGGAVLIQAPFGDEDVGVHIREHTPVSEVMKASGFVQETTTKWRRMK